MFTLGQVSYVEDGNGVELLPDLRTWTGLVSQNNKQGDRSKDAQSLRQDWLKFPFSSQTFSNYAKTFRGHYNNTYFCKFKLSSQ